ncbi:MAG TPA: hypothetical protein VJS88_05870 [Chthoniobacterales bacterium]|nr:hypothetical protein [Chthoniobacterales bacterium]
MKASALIVFALIAGTGLFLGGCETTSTSAPPITASFLRAGIRQHADAATLTEGRRLYLNRCIQCHALPAVAEYDPAGLKAVVAKMSGRANLTEAQHEAVLKYLLTVRSQ